MFWIDPKDRSTDFDIMYNVQSIRKSINLLFRIFYFVKRNKMKDFDWFIFSYFIYYTLSKYALYKILCFHPKQLIIVLIEQHFRSHRKKKRRNHATREYSSFSLYFNKRETKTCLELFSQLFLRQLRLIVSLIEI